MKRRVAHVFAAFGWLALTGCSKSPPPTRVSQPTSFNLYFVTLNPAHPPGEAIGCGDVLIGERQTIADRTKTRLERAVRAQLVAKPPAGAVNRLADLHVSLRSIDVDGRRATIVLEPFAMGGECDAPRVEAQLTRLVGQFTGFDRVDLMVDGRTLSQYLSLR
jgi:hypothetical protein